jgi:hypothetical protein
MSRNPSIFIQCRKAPSKLFPASSILRLMAKFKQQYLAGVVTIPAGIPHYFWNGGEIEAHYIQRFNPSMHIDIFFKTYFSLARNNKLNKKGLPNLFLISLISLNHQNEIRLIKPPWAVQIFIFSILAPVGRLLGYKEAYE